MPKFKYDATMIRLTGLSINTVASIIMTLRVILIHKQYMIVHTYDPSTGSDAETIQNDREVQETAMTYTAAVMYVIAFFFYLWSAFLEQSNRRKERYLLEKFFGVDFHDIHGVTMDDVEDFEEEKRRGYTIRKAKDIHRDVKYESHKSHVNVVSVN